MIDIESLSKSYGSRTLWSNINLTVERGEMLALVGPSGSGKSTLLNCIGLLDRPSSGVIRYAGKDITRFGRRESRQFRRDTLGYLFQHYALIESETVERNLEVASRPRRSMQGRPDTAIAEALERVGLAGRGKEMIHQLSGGEQQRVALARILVQQSTLVLADEPTGALDDANTAVVVDILSQMSRAGCAVVIATHDADVRDRCDNVFAVQRSTFIGTPAPTGASAEK